MTTQKLKVAKHLTGQEYDLLITTHAKHTKYMDEKTQAKYSLKNIKKVKRSSEPGVLEVHWEDEWFHYTSRNQWY